MDKVKKTSMKKQKKSKAQAPKKAMKIQPARSSAPKVMPTSASRPITPRLALFQMNEMEATIPKSRVTRASMDNLRTRDRQIPQGRMRDQERANLLMGVWYGK